MSRPEHSRPRVEELARRYRDCPHADSGTALGFSARLNLLWDLAGLAPSLLEGRVLGILAINPEWRENELRRWLQQDVLPPRQELRNMVRFLVAELGPEHDHLRWEAFLVYGTPVVASPLEHLLYQQDAGRREIAARILARLAERYRIPPSSYDADAAFQHCLRLMQQLNIYEWQDFQAGHLEVFRSLLFPRDGAPLDEKAGFSLPSAARGENTVKSVKE